jgi:hypothetical protein
VLAGRGQQVLERPWAHPWFHLWAHLGAPGDQRPGR